MYLIAENTVNETVEGKRFYDIHYCVKSVLVNWDEADTLRYRKHFKWGVDAFRRLNLANVLPSLRSARLPIIDTPFKHVILPNDYIDYIKIGICYQGYVYTLDSNPRICLPSNDLCGCEEQIADCTNNISEGVPHYHSSYHYSYLGYFHNGQYVAGQYGLGEGFYGGGYRIDEQYDRIILDSCVEGDTLLLEYKSRGLQSDGNAVVPEYAIPAMTTFIEWQREKYKRNKRAIDVEMARKDFSREFKALNHRRQSFTPEEYLQSCRKHIHQLPKR